MSSRPVSPESGSRVPEEPTYQLGLVELQVLLADGRVVTRKVGFPIRGDGLGAVVNHPSGLDMSAIAALSKKYLFPASARFIPPRPVDRACCPARGYVAVFVDCLKFGLQFSLPSVFTKLLQTFRLPLGQIMPNTFKQLVCLGVEAHRVSVPFSLKLILRLFSFKNFDGSFYLAPRSGSGIRAKTSSKLSNWQRKFFFFRVDGVLDF